MWVSAISNNFELYMVLSSNYYYTNIMCFNRFGFGVGGQPNGRHSARTKEYNCTYIVQLTGILQSSHNVLCVLVYICLYIQCHVGQAVTSSPSKS